MQQHPKYNPDNAIQFGRQLRQHRHSKHIPISIAAVCIGISVAHLSNIELGYETVPTAFADTLFARLDAIDAALPVEREYTHVLAANALATLDVPIFHISPLYWVEESPYKTHYSGIIKDKEILRHPKDGTVIEEFTRHEMSLDAVKSASNQQNNIPVIEDHPDLGVLQRWMRNKKYTTRANQIIIIIDIIRHDGGFSLLYRYQDDSGYKAPTINVLHYTNVYAMDLYRFRLLLTSKNLYPIQ